MSAYEIETEILSYCHRKNWENRILSKTSEQKSEVFLCRGDLQDQLQECGQLIQQSWAELVMDEGNVNYSPTENK